MDSLKVKLSFPACMLEFRVLLKLVRFSGEDLDFSSWWSSLSEKITVFGIMELVKDMAIYSKRKIIPNAFGLPYLLLYFSCNLFLCLSPEMRIFAYSEIMRGNVKAHHALLCLVNT